MTGTTSRRNYVETHFSCAQLQKDLIRRLRNVVEALGDTDVEPNSPDYPGLGGLSAILVEDGFLEHRDKDVRLHTVLACMQLLEVVSLFTSETAYIMRYIRVLLCSPNLSDSTTVRS